MSTETITDGARHAVAAAASNAGWWPNRRNLKILGLACLLAAFFVGFFTYMFRGAPFITSDKSRVLIKGVNMDQTLVIAERELEKAAFTSPLTLWGIRDQVYTVEQAHKVLYLYFRYIDTLKDYFRIWHLTWAISDIYRNGNAAVQAQLELAYQDAAKRAKAAGGIANLHVNGKILMGDIHLPARLFVKAHVVAPGTPGYLQSLEDYRP